MAPNLLSRRRIRTLFQKHRIYPSKKLGQNFLVDEPVIKKVVSAANLRPNDAVLEIGPGAGNLTRELAKMAKKVIAVEKDPRMIEVLKETLNDFQNIKVVSGDVLKLEIWKLFKDSKTEPARAKVKMRTSFSSPFKTQNSYKVVANLPFYLTSPVIRKFLESKNPPKEMILMVQKEIGQRICAKPPYMNLLAVSVQFYAQPEIINYVSKKSFWPQPKVDSAVLRIAPLTQADRKLINVDLFFKIVRAGFSQPRKQILNNLAKVLKLEKEKTKSWLFKNRVQPSKRAETLTIEGWVKLTNSFKNYFKQSKC